MFDMEHRLVAMFSSYADAAKIMGVTRQAITHCAKGEKLTCAGYYWREIDHNVVVDSDDLSTLMLADYDSSVGLIRKAYKSWETKRSDIINVSDFKNKNTRKR